MKIFLPLLACILLGTNYSLAQDMFEPNNDASNAALINCSNTIEAFIQSEGDLDWYSLQVNQPGALSVDLFSVPSVLDLNLEIYQFVDNQLKFIADDDDDFADGGQDLTATAFVEAGAYLILVEDENSNGSTASESYSMRINCSENQFEINQTIDLAAAIPQDTCFEDNIWGENDCYSTTGDGDDDQDWFELQINQAGTLKATLTQVPSDMDLNLEIYILENNQAKRIADDDDDFADGGQDLTAVAFINAGTYYIHIEDENHDRTNEESYNFCVDFTPNAIEINQTIELAVAIPQDTCFEDNIWGENECYNTSSDGDDDQDWFKVQINQAGTLSAVLTQVPSDMDLNLEIYIMEDNQAKRIADDDDDFADGGQDLTATAYIIAGTYYIHIEDENHDRTNEEFYNFCVDFTPNVFEINQTIELAVAIPQDTCFEDNIWGENECYNTSSDGDDDQDWFKVQINQAGSLSAVLTQVPSDMDLNLEIYIMEDNQAKRIADDDDDFADGGQDLIATAFINAGTYYIHIEDENHDRTNEDFYNFCLDFTANAFEINQTIELAAAIPQDTCFEDNIWGENECYNTSSDGDDDQDWFKVQIGESGKLNAVLTDVPANMDLNLEIYMIENNQAKRIADDDDDFADGGQDLTATAFINEGTYYIHIEDEDHNTTNKETYNFCLSFIPNAFEINQTIELAALIPQDTCFEDNIWGENECFITSSDGDDDQDWFQIQISEPGKLNAVLTDVPTNLDLNLEIYMIEENQAKRIADDDDDFADGGQDLTATAFINAGTYYIHIEDEDHNATNKETYNLCLNFTPNKFEINQTIDLAAPIPQDTCFEDNIWGENECFNTTYEGDNDQDWFVINFDSSCILNAVLSNIPSSLNLNLEIYQLNNGQESLIASGVNNNSYGSPEIRAELNVEQGAYYIHIEQNNNNLTIEESFTFCISCEKVLSSFGLINQSPIIYPNPTSGLIFIQGLDQTAEYKIMDVNGKIISSSWTRNNEVDITSLESGLYFITVLYDDQLITRKIVKK